MASASSTVRPLIHSVARDELAMAEPQPKVLELGVLDDALVVDLDLQAHDVAAGGRSGPDRCPRWGRPCPASRRSWDSRNAR